MKDKAKRLRGSNTHGRGYNKHKSGARGGTGMAGLWDHKRISDILQKKKSRRVTSIRDIESKLDRYIKKKYITVSAVEKEKSYSFTRKFTDKYRKILSQGEPTGKYLPNRHLKFSKTTKIKCL